MLDKAKSKGYALVIVGAFWLSVCLSEKLLRTSLFMTGSLLLIVVGALVIWAASKS